MAASTDDTSGERRLAPAPRSGDAHAGLARLPLSYRLRELVTGYLPLLVMAVLALATWWLVENSPQADADRGAVLPMHVPDYTMNQFMVERFTKTGGLRLRIQGDELRHYPDTETIEVDNPRIRTYADDGKVTVATARQALSNADGSEVQLLGDAKVIRDADAGGPSIEFRGEFMHAFFNSGEVRSHLPVTIRHGANVLRADSLDYKHDERRLQLNGRVRATFPAAASR